MKLLKYLMTATLFPVMLLTTGCDNCSECPEPPLPEPLTDTKWKLAGIVDTETGEVEKLEPKRSDYSYTLTFITDTKAEVRGFLRYDPEEPIKLDLYRLGQYEYPDDYSFPSLEDKKFFNTLYNYNTKSFTVISGKLMFINNTEKYYLLFEPYDKVVADEKEFEKNQIMGRWKLLEVSIYIDRSLHETIDYSEDNIMYDFQDNNKLIITGQILDGFSLFDDFREGEYSYRYWLPAVCSVCLPGPNLFIFTPERGELYFCKIPSDKKTMEIGGDKGIGSDNIGFVMSLTKIE